MNYLAQAKLTQDDFIILRLKACASTYPQYIDQPHQWVMANIWALSAQPGWADAYARVLEGQDTTDPANWAGIAGADPNIITDAMIKAGVESILKIDSTPNEQGAGNGDIVNPGSE